MQRKNYRFEMNKLPPREDFDLKLKKTLDWPKKPLKDKKQKSKLKPKRTLKKRSIDNHRN